MSSIPFKSRTKENQIAGPRSVGPPARSGKPVVLPEVQVYDRSLACPSVATRGVSGSGKTEAIAHLLRGGKNVLVIDVEDKFQSLIKYDPMVLSLGAPVVERATGAKRPPTWHELYDRIWGFTDALGEGKYREWNGRPIDIIAGDGFMEVCNVIARFLRLNKPKAESSGRDNTLAMFQEIGDRGTDFLRAVKQAASAASTAYGIKPVGMYWTVGEVRRTTKLGEVTYQLELPGNITPDKFPFQFEAIFRLVVRRDLDGRPLYVLQTVGEEGVFEAKCPGGVLEPEVLNWNFNEVYDKLTEWYRSGAKLEGDKP